MAASFGTKVTSDPETLNNPKNENPGVVTSDSLAAESINSGGAFAANSETRGPSGQPSYSTTTNTTDDSNATRLEPAPDAETRLKTEKSGENVPSVTGRQPGETPGVGPTYAAATSRPADQGSNHGRPKGDNLQEGGFDSNAPNASFSTDIGGKNDPGRVALEQLEESNVPVAGGAGPRQTQVSNDGQYDTLGETSA